MGWLRNFIFGVDPAHDDAGLSKQVRDWGAEKNNDMSPQSDDAVDSEKGQEKEQHDGNQHTEPSAYRTASGAKVLPTLTVDRVEPHLSNNLANLELWITLHNRSPYDIEITKVDLLKQSTDPDRFLRAGESHEIRVYRGQTPRDRAYTKAYIDLKITGTGDYFRQEYMINYDLKTSGGTSWYVPDALRKSLPPRDI